MVFLSPLNRIDIQDSSHTFTCFSPQEKKNIVDQQEKNSRFPNHFYKITNKKTTNNKTTFMAQWKAYKRKISIKIF